MTSEILFAGQTLTAGVDGRVPANTELNGDFCCFDPVCQPSDAVVCSFIDLLPSGQLWDEQKARAASAVTNGTEADLPCPSLASYAVYTARVLQSHVSGALVQSVREADPCTAVDTLDDWLDRLDWVDCYNNSCRSKLSAQTSPYETFDAECSATYFVPPVLPADFELAMKHAILVSLTRMQRGVIKNIDGLNWIIAPLFAELSATQPYPQVVQDYIDGVDTTGTGCFCEYTNLTLSPIGTTLPEAPTAATFCNLEARATVGAEIPYTDGDGNTVNIFPNVIAAECIVRAVLGRNCPNIITRS